MNVRKLLPRVIIKEAAHLQAAGGQPGHGAHRLALACPHALNSHLEPERRVNDETDSAAYTVGFKVRHRRVIEAAGDTWQPPAPCVSPTACVCSCVRARGSHQPLLLFMYTCVRVFKGLICIKYVEHLSQTLHECTEAAAVSRS